MNNQQYSRLTKIFAIAVFTVIITCFVAVIAAHAAKKSIVYATVDPIETPPETEAFNTVIVIENDDVNGTNDYVETETETAEVVEETVPETLYGLTTEELYYYARNLTDEYEDLYYLTHVLTGEVHTYPWDEQIMVGTVVLNRVADPEYPDTIRGVIEDRHYGIQYACFYDGNFFRNPTDRNIEVAIYLLQNGPQAPADVVYQSARRQGSGVYCKLGHHYFCYK